MAIGDFNGDGILDLVVANEGTYPNYTDGGVSILLGNGDGTFQAAQKYEAVASPICVALGDFNGDGIPDLAVSNPSESVVHVLLGNGDGTFQTYPISYLRQGVCNSLAVGDFNGDGRADLAAGLRYVQRPWVRVDSDQRRHLGAVAAPCRHRGRCSSLGKG